jgi:hypothetical protein
MVDVQRLALQNKRSVMIAAAESAVDGLSTTRASSDSSDKRTEENIQKPARVDAAALHYK